MMHRISLQEGKVNRDQIVTITGSKPLLYPASAWLNIQPQSQATPFDQENEFQNE